MRLNEKIVKAEGNPPGSFSHADGNFDRHTMSWARFCWYVLAVVGITAFAYFLAARLSLSILNLGFEASPVWPPAGIALAALLWHGRWAVLGVALGAFWTNYSLGVPWLLSIGSIAGTTLQAVVGASLLQQIKFCTSLERLRDVLGFFSLAVLLAPAVNATIGTLNALLIGHFGWNQVAQNWWTIWLGDGMGILIFTPSLLALRQWVDQKSSKISGFSFRFGHSTQPSPPSNNAAQGTTQTLIHNACTAHLPRSTDRPSGLERWLWLASLIAVSWMVFYSQPGKEMALYPLEYLPFPFVMWAALRFGQVKAILASFILSVIAISGTSLGLGPFVAKADDSSQVILLLQAFIGVITITAMILAAVMTTRQDAEAQLRLTLERDRLIGEMAMRIRQSLNLQDILQTTVEEVRQFLQADRVLFCCIDTEGQSKVVAESVAEGWVSSLGDTSDASVYSELQAIFAHNRVQVVHDTSKADVAPLIKQYHDCYQVKAGIAVPIMANEGDERLGFGVWQKSSAAGDASPKDSQAVALEPSSSTLPHLLGVLVVNQCSAPRQWQPLEVELLEQLGTQVAIAVQQGRLYQQVRALNANLEHQVAERTLQLQANMAELEELNHLRDVFLHAIAHDLRTTVMGSLMVLKSLQNQSGDNIVLSRTLLERMVHSGEIQLCKLNSLLEAYKNKTEGIVITPSRMNLAAFVQAVLGDLKPLFEHNQAIAINQLPETLPPVRADAAQLERVVRHLLVNAVKHNPPGVQVTIGAMVEGDKLRCFVADNGKGMSPQQCDRLFDLRIGTAQERQLTGISLGLYLCHQIITAHGGTIGVESEVGRGSRFWFTLPLS